MKLYTGFRLHAPSLFWRSTSLDGRELYFNRSASLPSRRERDIEHSGWRDTATTIQDHDTTISPFLVAPSGRTLKQPRVLLNRIHPDGYCFRLPLAETDGTDGAVNPDLQAGPLYKFTQGEG